MASKYNKAKPKKKSYYVNKLLNVANLDERAEQVDMAVFNKILLNELEKLK